MKLTSHLKLLFFVTLVWFAFWLAGLPEYYRQYSTGSMILFVTIVFFPIYGVGYYLIKHRRRGSKFAHAVRLSVYFTLPFFVYDFIYCAWYLDEGWTFLSRYWYLSIYYVIPWIVFPPTGFCLDRLEGGGTHVL